MATPTIMQRLGKKASDYWNEIKSIPPSESELQGLREIQKNVEQEPPARGISNAQPELTEKEAGAGGTSTDHSPVEMVHPGAKYGSRPGEQRLDNEGNVVKPQMPQVIPTFSAPIYDDGGNVDVNDGKHQLAVLEDGEKVLTPEEAEVYNAEHNVSMNVPGKERTATPAAKPMMNLSLPTHEPEKLNTAQEGMKPMMTKPAPVDPTVSEAGAKEVGMHPSQQKPTQEEPQVKGTDAERKAIEVDKQKAMGQGNLVKLGIALLNERHLNPSKSMMPKLPLYDDGGTVVVDKDKTPEQLKVTAPPEFNQGYRPMMPSDPQHGMEMPGSKNYPDAAKAEASNIPQGVTAPKEMQRPQMAPMQTEEQPAVMQTPGQPPAQPTKTLPKTPEDRKTMLDEYDNIMADSLDKAAHDPANAEDYKKQHDYAAFAKQALLNKTPWGSESNHPGILGKIGHDLAKVGNIAGDIVAPKTMMLIPGTQLNTEMKTSGLTKMLNEDEANDAKFAKVGTADWKPLPTPVKGADGKDYVDMYNAKTNEHKQGPLFEAKPTEGKPSDQAAFMEQWYKDHPEATKSAEHDATAIQAYHAAEQQPTTLMEPVPGHPGMLQARQVKPGEQVSTEAGKPGAEQSQEASVDKIFKGKTLVATEADGSRVPISFADAKARGFEGVTTLSEGQELKERDRATSYDTATKGIDQYQKDLDDAKLTPEDIKALGVITAAGQDEHSDFVKNFASGIMDTIVGEPITGYSQKAMGSLMTKDQYDNLSPAARKVAADYFNTMFLHFANVKATQGGMPRNPRMIAFEIGNIPLPYLRPDEAKPGFDNLRDRLGNQNRDNIRFKVPENKNKEENLTPPGTLNPGMKWQHTDPSKGPVKWRQVPENQ